MNLHSINESIQRGQGLPIDRTPHVNLHTFFQAHYVEVMVAWRDHSVDLTVPRPDVHGCLIHIHHHIG